MAHTVKHAATHGRNRSLFACMSANWWGRVSCQYQYCCSLACSQQVKVAAYVGVIIFLDVLSTTGGQHDSSMFTTMCLLCVQVDVANLQESLTREQAAARDATTNKMALEVALQEQQVRNVSFWTHACMRACVCTDAGRDVAPGSRSCDACPATLEGCCWCPHTNNQ